MNRERITQLRDVLAELPPERFNIRYWATDRATGRPHPILSTFEADFSIVKHDCGTAACIAGWALTLFKPEVTNIGSSAQTVLGLTNEQAYELFEPEGYSDEDANERFTAQAAVAALDHLLDTGEVRW